MKIQLVFFAVAGFILSHANALGDGLNLNPKNLYDQISAQVRVPLRAETSAVRSVIDTMKDLQQKLQSDQLRSAYDGSPLRNSQTHQQSYQGGVSSRSNVPQNIRREEVIQIREHQVVPSPHFTQQSGVNPENQSLFNRNSQNIHRQVYQNKQVEKFNQELSYITTQNPVHPQQADNNQQGYQIFPQRSKQETVVQRSFKQETVIPKQPYDGRQQPISSKSLHQQDFNAQPSTSDRNQQDQINQRFNNNQIQQDFNAQRFNNQNQQDFNAQRLNNQNQQDFNAQRFNNQNQQDFIAQRLNNNQNQQDFNAQRFNNNQNQQDLNAQRVNNNNQNQQRQYQSEDRLSSRQSANNEGYRVAIPLQDNRPQIISYDLFNRNIELNGQRSYHASNQLNQAYVNRDSNNEQRKLSEREQQQFRFEANKSNLSSDNLFGQNNQNEKSKYAEVKVSGPVSEILNVASNIKGNAFNRQLLKTPFTAFNNGHLL